MKYITIILFLLNGLTSYAQEKEEVETILLDCLENSFNEIHIDLNRELEELEQYLIYNGMLNSSSGQSYYEFYKQVVEINNIPNELDIDKFDNLIKLKPNEYYSNSCLQRLTKTDSIDTVNSKYFLMTLKIQEMETTGKTSLSSVAEVITSVLTPSDFDKPYYRTITLLAIVNTSSIETGIKKRLEPENKVNNSNSKTVSILANSKSEIIYNERIINVNIFRSELYKFIKQNQKNHLIVFSGERETTYKFYTKVQGFIFEIYSRLRDEKAKELYEKSFSNLTEDEKDIIKEIYPINIEES